MASNQTYKAFTTRPTHVMDLNGVLLDASSIMGQLAAEVQGISGYATYVVRNDIKLAVKLRTPLTKFQTALSTAKWIGT